MAGASETRRRSGRKSNKRSRAAKKAARTRARNKAHRRAAAKKGARKRKRKGGGHRKTHRKSSKRSRAAKRGAATRRRREATKYDDIQGAVYERKRRRKRRKARRKNPVVAGAATERKRRRRRRNPVAAAETKRRRRPRRHQRRRGLHYTGKPRTRRRRANDARRGWDRRKGRRIRRNPVRAAERRRHHRKHSRRRNPLPNPISGAMEFLGGVLGVGTGFGIASFVDRMLTTHALTNNQDAPAVGQIYNSEALLTPIWSSWQRMAGAAGSIIAPLVLARFVNTHLGLKSFLQLAGFGALGRTAGKAMDDAIAQTMSTNATVQQLYGGEIAAKAKMATAATTALPAVAPGAFAGIPRFTGRANVARAFPSPSSAPVRQFAGAPTQRALGGFQELPGRAGGLGSSAAADPDTQVVQNVLPLTQPIPNAQPPVPASTSLFLPALCNPDGQT